MHSSFADHFSTQAQTYARHRPHYPAELFAYLAEVAPARGAAWDNATGNGQAAVALAERFHQVFATDASEAQIRSAKEHPRVRYEVAPAQRSGLADGSVDLVTVAQALHWFAGPPFYREAQRVLRPGGILAVWTYGHVVISEAVDAVMEHYYREVVGPFWPDERRHVEAGYQDLEIPFVHELKARAFAIETSWRLEGLRGYLRSWSASQRYADHRQEDPLAAIHGPLAEAWGDPTMERPLRWPLALRVGTLETVVGDLQGPRG